MSSFSLSGGVEVLGFISPTDSLDTYAVIDPLYGVDGFRNVNLLSDLDLIPEPRRRAGMVVGVSGGTTYYKLNSSPWNYNFSDWSVFNTGGGSVSGDYLPLSGGTVTGNTVFTLGLSANTISATTYQNLPTDIRVTGGTYNNGTTTFTNNTGGTFNVNGFYTGETSYVNSLITGFGLSADTTTGDITIINTDPDQVVVLNNGTNINVMGTYPNFTIDVTGLTDFNTFTTGFTYSSNTFTILDNSGNTFDATFTDVTGLTVNGDLNITGTTYSNVISATTYQNLPITTDVFVTGGTYSAGTSTFTNNTGGTFNVTGFYTGETSYVNSLTTGVGLSADTTNGDITIINTDPDQVVTISGGTGILTGGTYPNFTIENTLPDQTVVLNDGTNISVTGTYPNFTIDVTGLTDNNTYTTGFTYQDNTFTISDSSGNTLNAAINSVTGLTVNGTLSASTISGGTLYGDGSNLTGLSTGLNVGTTQITNGTSGRVLFQSGTTLQQDGNFTFDPTLKRLTLRAVGTAVTDIPLVVRNSADTFDILACYGNELTIIGRNQSSEPRLIIDRAGSTKMVLGGTTNLNIQFPNSGFGQLNSGTQGWDIISSTGDIRTRNSSTFTILKGNFFGVGIANPTARLDVQAQGSLSTDIVFRVRNSADTADLISFRGDGSEWIQSVPFRHAAYLTGTNNTTQGLFLGYNVASLSTTSTNAVIIGRGSGAILQGNGNTIIGDGFSHGTVSNSIGLGRGVFVNGSNQFVSGSELYPTNTWLVSTGGEVNGGSNLRGLDFKVSGTGAGPSNISAQPYPVRFYSPNGTGSGLGSNIQFHVAPSNTGGAAFNRNIFSEIFTVRGEADGLNHYQLSTPRVPSASVTDGYIQYSNDITAGNAAPHFRTEAGNIVKLYTHSAVTTTQGIADALTTLGLLSVSTISPSTDYYVTGGTYDYTGGTVTLNRNDGNNVSITGFNYNDTWTVELINALSVDVYSPYNLAITSTINILGSPTITLYDDNVSYSLGNTIAIGSKITIVASVTGVTNLNIIRI
jgi:hypothetical protein